MTGEQLGLRREDGDAGTDLWVDPGTGTHVVWWSSYRGYWHACDGSSLCRDVTSEREALEVLAAHRGVIASTKGDEMSKFIADLYCALRIKTTSLDIDMRADIVDKVEALLKEVDGLNADLDRYRAEAAKYKAITQLLLQ